MILDHRKISFHSLVVLINSSTVLLIQWFAISKMHTHILDSIPSSSLSRQLPAYGCPWGEVVAPIVGFLPMLETWLAFLPLGSFTEVEDTVGIWAVSQQKGVCVCVCSTQSKKKKVHMPPLHSRLRVLILLTVCHPPLPQHCLGPVSSISP